MGFLLFDAIVIAMQSHAPTRALAGPLRRGQLCERSWARRAAITAADSYFRAWK
jgi:hypothetical protein